MTRKGGKLSPGRLYYTLWKWIEPRSEHITGPMSHNFTDQPAAVHIARSIDRFIIRFIFYPHRDSINS